MTCAARGKGSEVRILDSFGQERGGVGFKNQKNLRRLEFIALYFFGMILNTKLISILKVVTKAALIFV